MKPEIHVRAPGRVNLIGEHTDYTGGLALPMAINRWTVIRGSHHEGSIQLTSNDEADPVHLMLPIQNEATVEPPWGRYVAGVAAEMATSGVGFSGHVSTTIPVGAGLSSSAALELATALVLGYQGSAEELAKLCRRAEHRATGMPCGILDQLSIAAAVEGHALLIDCHTLETTPVPVPPDLEIVIRFIAHRTLVGSKYADRVRECALAEQAIGPLRLATIADCTAISDAVVRSRARHVVAENERVREFCVALAANDLRRLGEILVEGHNSLRDQFATSTVEMDNAVESMCAVPGVYGARMTGGGFGGCIVALCEPGSVNDGWVVRPVGAAGHFAGG